MNHDATLPNLSIPEHCVAAHGTRKEIILYPRVRFTWWIGGDSSTNSTAVMMCKQLVSPRVPLRFCKSFHNLMLEQLDLAETGRSTP